MMSHVKLFLDRGVGEIPMICSRVSPVAHDLSSPLERERRGDKGGGVLSGEGKRISDN